MALPFNITPGAALSALDLGSDLFGIGLNIDVVGVYDSTSLLQVFPEARPIKASVRESSKVMEQPMETGAVIADHHIINPKEIDLVLLIKSQFYSSTYAQIKNAMVSATLLSIQTKASVYPNMIVQAMPHEEESDKYDAISMLLRLREVLFTVPNAVAQPNAPANYSPVDPVNQNTAPRGQQSELIVTIPSAVLSYAEAIYAWGR